jgi:hypothetical protein
MPMTPNRMAGAAHFNSAEECRMQTNSRQIIIAYEKQKNQTTSPRSRVEDRLLKQLDKTRKVLLGEGDTESFADVLERTSAQKRH